MIHANLSAAGDAGFFSDFLFCGQAVMHCKEHQFQAILDACLLKNGIDLPPRSLFALGRVRGDLTYRLAAHDRADDFQFVPLESTTSRFLRLVCRSKWLLKKKGSVCSRSLFVFAV
jgi:hypothetical protein